MPNKIAPGSQYMTSASQTWPWKKLGQFTAPARVILLYEPRSYHFKGADCSYRNTRVANGKESSQIFGLASTVNCVFLDGHVAPWTCPDTSTWSAALSGPSIYGNNNGAGGATYIDIRYQWIDARVPADQ
jgi:prepilin-type processing-associated H-X9-DG protein